MKILALIPARGGSKRLPRKNILPLDGKPLISWSIDIVKDIPEICDILVSTDDPEIAEVSKKSGALVPWLRPAELATDTASSVDAALHAVKWYQKNKGRFDGILLLQPTSPFRSIQYVKKGIALFRETSKCNIVGVSQKNHAHPLWAFKLNEGKLTSYIDDDNFQKRTQDLPEAYYLNGSFYLIETKQFIKEKSFILKNPTPLINTSQPNDLDIDTNFDFKLAELLSNSYEK